MITVRHKNGTIFLQDGHVKITISNLEQISEMIEKIKKFSHHMDEDGFKKKIHILDLMSTARQELICYEQKKILEQHLINLNFEKNTSISN